MWRATWKGLVGHKARLVLTVVAIVLGTGFVSGSYIFTDTLDGAFQSLFTEAFADTDVIIRPAIDEDLSFVTGDRLDAGFVEQIREVEGVEGAEGTIAGFLLLSRDGEFLGNRGGGPPTIGSAWIETGNPLTVRDGAAPANPGEMVIDAASAGRFGLTVGSTVQVTGLGRPVDMKIVGLVGLGTSDGFGGATALAFTRDQAEELFDAEGRVDAINVVISQGVTVAQMIERITPLLPDGVEAIDSRTAVEEQLSGFKQALGFINTFLLIFGLVSLFVGGFLIQNTFQIIVTQRGRELAMLRAVGATRAQVIRMVVTESLIIGAFGSGLGVVTGMGLTFAIRAAFRRFGANLPATELVIRPATVLIAMSAGMVVTLLASLIPAFAASRIPPVAAMRQLVSTPRQRSLRLRLVSGSVVTAAGVALSWIGLSPDIPQPVSPVAMVGAGAGAMFIGVSILTALMVRPVGRFLGGPLAATGVVGTVARENAIRSPRRTAATSSALMIGTALAGLALILGSSLSATTDALIADRFRSDLVIQPTGFGSAELSPEIGVEISRLPEVAAAVSIRRNAAKLGDERLFLGSADMEGLVALIQIETLAGSLTGLGPDQVAISQDLAEETSLATGDSVTLTFARTGPQPFTVGAVYRQEGPGVEAYITPPAWEANFSERFDSAVFVKLAEEVDLESGRAALERVTGGFPGAEVLDQNQFAEQAKEQINGLVGLVFALLALTLLIGFFGILNTLLLSIIERTREIGLLRAVGTTRAQLEAMVTWESVMVAVFGAVLGVLLGVFFGWAIVTALQQDDELVLSIPYAWLSIALVAAAVAGVIAAVYPAWRASRLNVLAAIAYE